MAYTNVANVKTYAGIKTAEDDDLLHALIDRAQKAIDSYCGRTFEAAADSTRKFTVGIDTDDDMLFFDEDLAQIGTSGSIITDADSASPVTLTISEYIFHPRNRTPYHAVELLDSSSNSWTYTTNPQNGITVTGRWAWSVTAPDDIVHACTRLAAYYFRQKDASVFDVTAIPEAGVIQVPQGMPADVKLILNNYRKNF